VTWPKSLNVRLWNTTGRRVDLGGSTHDAEGIRDPKARTYAQKLDRLREDASRWEVN